MESDSDFPHFMYVARLKAKPSGSQVGRAMGKETVEVRESPGFVTSRMNALLGAEAFRMWEEGVASPEDIDKALKLGLNHPMGPFEMVDLVGLDVRLASMNNLQSTLGEAFAPSPILKALVADGRLGRKTGRGVYRYEDGERVPGSGEAPFDEGAEAAP
ncbi:hypothetical protein IIA16_06980 [bacterium]|nr:hypothetical protein [bacterium]